MPIGKNSIKRVTNNGYSNVKASAPDMENSVVTEEKSATVTEKITPPTAEPIKKAPKAPLKPKAEPKAKKKATKTAPKKSMETEPDFSAVKIAEKVTKEPSQTSKRQGNGYVNLGGELPYYLL